MVSPSGKYVTSIDVTSGTIDITYGNQANANVATKKLSLNPGVSTNNDVIWLCGYNVGTGMAVAPDQTGTEGDQTDISPKYVPASCRAQ